MSARYDVRLDRATVTQHTVRAFGSGARGKHGQAVTELALALTVLVPLLLFTLYFADLAFLRLKTQEASHAAMWDLTHVAIEHLPGPATDARIGQSIDDTRTRYQDYDGRRSPQSLRTTGTVFTPRPQLELWVSQAALAPAGLRPVPALATVFGDLGGVRVEARTTVRTQGLTRSFLEGAGGFFSTPLHDRPDVVLRAAGAPYQPGRGAVIALGDFGLAGLAQAGECLPTGGSGCPNRTFLAFVQGGYDVTTTAAAVPPGRASALAIAVWNTDFSEEDALRLAFTGAENGFQVPMPGPGLNHPHPDNQPTSWTISPGGPWPFGSPSPGRYVTAYACRQHRFLGGVNTPCPP